MGPKKPLDLFLDLMQKKKKKKGFYVVLVECEREHTEIWSSNSS